MAGKNEDRSNRTEKPTEKRKQDFRKRGEIAQSKDLTMVGALWGGLLGGLILLGSSTHAVLSFTRETLGDLSATGDFHGLLRTIGWATLPVGLGVVLGAMTAGLAQLGWPPAFRFPRPSFARFLSTQAVKKILSPKEVVVRGLFEFAKFAVVALAAAEAVRREYARFRTIAVFDAAVLPGYLLGAVKNLVFLAGGALAVLAALHYLRARFEHGAQLKMTREELKREAKEQEGDPHIKGRRRRRMRELARRRIAVVVPKADVVIVNPTEYAVALRYHAGKDRAPRVLAKGRGVVAQRIRDLARAALVPIVSEPPLARLLHKVVPEGKEIPTNLYRAVAEVLAYVYRLRNRSAQLAAAAQRPTRAGERLGLAVGRTP